MLVTYVDTCVVCACSSLRDEAGRRPLPGSAACTSGCACHTPVPASMLRAARASGAAAGQDAARFRLFRRRPAAVAGRSAAR